MGHELGNADRSFLKLVLNGFSLKSVSLLFLLSPQPILLIIRLLQLCPIYKSSFNLLDTCNLNNVLLQSGVQSRLHYKFYKKLIRQSIKKTSDSTAKIKRKILKNTVEEYVARILKSIFAIQFHTIAVALLEHTDKPAKSNIIAVFHEYLQIKFRSLN